MHKASPRVRKYRERQRNERRIARVEVQVPEAFADSLKVVAGRLRAPVAALQSGPFDVDAHLLEAATIWRSAMDRFGATCLENIDLSKLPSHVERMKSLAGALMERGGRDGFIMGRRLQALAEAL